MEVLNSECEMLNDVQGDIYGAAGMGKLAHI
jgi:hypothetical protein